MNSGITQFEILISFDTNLSRMLSTRIPKFTAQVLSPFERFKMSLCWCTSTTLIREHARRAAALQITARSIFLIRYRGNLRRLHVFSFGHRVEDSFMASFSHIYGRCTSRHPSRIHHYSNPPKRKLIDLQPYNPSESAQPHFHICGKLHHVPCLQVTRHSHVARFWPYDPHG